MILFFSLSLSLSLSISLSEFWRIEEYKVDTTENRPLQEWQGCLVILALIPRPLCISPCELTSLTVPASHGFVTCFDLRMLVYVQSSNLTALKRLLSITNHSVLSVCRVCVPWMLDKCYIFPPQLQGLETNLVNKMNSRFTTKELELN